MLRMNHRFKKIQRGERYSASGHEHIFGMRGGSQPNLQEQFQNQLRDQLEDDTFFLAKRKTAHEKHLEA